MLVSHDRRAARVADRVVRIRDGRLSETWPCGGRRRARSELLVVDDRGWVRLPDALRHDGSGLVDGGHGRDRDDRQLRPVGAVAPRAASGPSGGDHRATARGSASQGAAVPRPRRHVASACGVRKAYGGRLVLDGAGLDVRAGRLHVVRGRSGSGKSTLLRVLLGLERPDAGTVRLDGADLADLDRAGLAAVRRRAAAVVGQDVHLAETVDVRTNLELARVVRGLSPDVAHGDAVLDGLGLLPAGGA